jgi:hypothetical protein
MTAQQVSYDLLLQGLNGITELSADVVILSSNRRR